MSRAFLSSDPRLGKMDQSQVDYTSAIWCCRCVQANSKSFALPLLSTLVDLKNKASNENHKKETKISLYTVQTNAS